MTAFTSIVPNLDRRPHRWWMTLGSLRALRFPFSSVQRFAAHDGNDYIDSVSAARAASQRHPNSVYLNKPGLAQGHYCWSWTWYEIMIHITQQPNDTYHLVLLDDCYPTCSYDDIIRYISKLNSIHTVKAIQFMQLISPHDQCNDHNEIANTPFRHGIHHSGSLMNLLTPVGAREIINFVDLYERNGVPCGIFSRLANALHMDGYYSPSLGAAGLGKHIRGNKYIGEPEDSL